MAATETIVGAARLPGPPELFPGKPDAIVDLQSAEGAALVGGEWRYSDCAVAEIGFVAVGASDDPLGPGGPPNRTYDVLPHAEGIDYDDSAWRVLRPDETMLRLANGRVCFNWYRLRSRFPTPSAISTRRVPRSFSKWPSTTMQRSGSTASFLSRSATWAVKSSEASTRRTASS
jgi:hypothetical protein